MGCDTVYSGLHLSSENLVKFLGRYVGQDDNLQSRRNNAGLVILKN
jgi:hypothetical protein